MATRTKTKLGTAGANMLKRHTGAEAVTATTRPAAVMKAKPTPESHMITTIRFATSQWHWLRRVALERALETGRRADASELVRELVADAMSAKGTGR